MRGFGGGFLVFANGGELRSRRFFVFLPESNPSAIGVNRLFGDIDIVSGDNARSRGCGFQMPVGAFVRSELRLGFEALRLIALNASLGFGLLRLNRSHLGGSLAQLSLQLRRAQARKQLTAFDSGSAVYFDLLHERLELRIYRHVLIGLQFTR